MKTKKKVIKLSESKLRNMIAESVKVALNELDWKTYANAASAARDRESVFKDVPGYPHNPMRRHYNDDGTLDMKQYEKDSERTFNQSRQPEKFKDAAYKGLSREVCGEDYFVDYLTKCVKDGTFEPERMKELIDKFMKGEDYIKNNKTQWSGRK